MISVSFAENDLHLKAPLSSLPPNIHMMLVVLQCVALCCSAFWRGVIICMNQLSFPLHLFFIVLQCVAVCCSAFSRGAFVFPLCLCDVSAVCCNVLQCVTACCSVLQCVAVCYSVLQCVAMCCSKLQCDAACHSVST